MIAVADHTLGHLTDQEILEITVKLYANPDNWEEYEKDYGEGVVGMRTPVCIRDKGAHAKQILNYIADRKAK